MSDSGEKRGRGRPRRADADGVILGVARDLLQETGLEAFSVDEVAQRSAIAKTTIYRRWPGKAALIGSVLEAELPHEATTVRNTLGEIARAMQLLGPVGIAGAEVLIPFIASRRDALRELVGSDKADVLADALAGALLLRFLSRSGTIDDDFIDTLTRQA